MKPGTSTRTFAAFVERNGLQLIEFQKHRDRIDILDRVDVAGDYLSLSDAAEALSKVLRDMGAGDSRLWMTLRGLGSSHHILVLPQAKPELLQPVVTREMQRLYPDLENPIVGFVSGEPLDRRARSRPDVGTPPQEVLAAAIPHAAMDSLIEILGRDRVELQHVTVLPRVLQRLYAEHPSPDAPSVVVIMLRSGPLFGFFFDKQMRLVVEPPAERDTDSIAPEFVIEQLERGNLYLRQQFRGAQISRLLLSAESAEYGPLSRAVEDGMGLIVERFAAQIGPSAAVAAMGAVLDSQDGEGLNLFPLGETKKKTAERTTRRVAIVAAVMLILISWWWAGNGVAAVTGWKSRISTLTTALNRRASPLQPLREVSDKRRETLQELAAIQRVGDERAKLQRLFDGLSLASQSGVSITRFTARRDPSGWNATVSGSASSYSASAAVGSVHRFYRELPVFLGSSSITLDSLRWSDPSADGAPTTISFDMRFVAPPIPTDSTAATGGTQ